MLIDENKIRNKSKMLMGGFKGVVPRVGSKNPTRFDYVRVFIGFCLTGALIVGTIILFINLLSVGKDIAERKTKPQDQEYIQVIFKPKGK